MFKDFNTELPMRFLSTVDNVNMYMLNLFILYTVVTHTCPVMTKKHIIN